LPRIRQAHFLNYGEREHQQVVHTVELERIWIYSWTVVEYCVKIGGCWLCYRSREQFWIERFFIHTPKFYSIPSDCSSQSVLLYCFSTRPLVRAGTETIFGWTPDAAELQNTVCCP